MKHTPLYEIHIKTALKVINLKGVARPLEYVGHIEEHRAIRDRVSICDASHMGEIEIQGKESLDLVQKLLTKDAAKLSKNQSLYSVMCDENGTIIDDLVCFRLAKNHFLWVVNVTKIEEDFQWILKQSQGMDVIVRNRSCELALIAIQGPNSREVLQRITKANLSTLKYYWSVETVINTSKTEVHCLVSRTGYTGELGYEILVARDFAPFIWNELMKVGRPLGIVPHGVAARESARVEAGYFLNGNDMDKQTNPFEVGLGWVVNLSKDFIGKKALEKIYKEGVIRKLVGFEIQDNYTVRHGYPIFANRKKIGNVTSGLLSANIIKRSVGLGFLAIDRSGIGTEIEIGIKNKKCEANVVKLTFFTRRVKDEPNINTFSPYQLRFSTSHQWVGKENKDIFSIGITDYAQREIGNALFVELPKIGKKVKKDSIVGWIDTYNKQFDIKCPFAGEIVEINIALIKNPEQINKYPYAYPGIMKIKPENPHEYKILMPFEKYLNFARDELQYDIWSKDIRTT